MRIFLIAVAVLLSVCLLPCRAGTDSATFSINKVSIGMTLDKVKLLLGSPTSQKTIALNVEDIRYESLGLWIHLDNNKVLEVGGNTLQLRPGLVLRNGASVNSLEKILGKAHLTGPMIVYYSKDLRKPDLYAVLGPDGTVSDYMLVKHGVVIPTEPPDSHASIDRMPRGI